MCSAGTQKFTLVALSEADVREQARQQGLMQCVLARLCVGHRPSEAASDLAELSVQVLPFADPQVVQELGAAHASELIGRQLVSLLPQVLPQLHVRQEVRILDGETGMLLVCSLLVLGGTLPHVLNRQRRHHHQRVTKRSVAVGLDQHSCHSRIDRKGGQFAADRGELGSAVLRGRLQCSEFFQQADTVADAAWIGRLDEGKRVDLAQSERGHLQNDRGQIGAQNFRLGELRTRLEVFLRVQPDTDPVGDASAATRPLARRRL
ncbi:unannotated protein [freshwater metagenome]|uniref:Unannotated protein n=1 Tax=freshwater metagenome TaxID=449393 RepID=A0A6J7IDV7_9ZZZZ